MCVEQVIKMKASGTLQSLSLTWACSWGWWLHGSWRLPTRWHLPAPSAVFFGWRWLSEPLPQPPPADASAASCESSTCRPIIWQMKLTLRWSYSGTPEQGDRNNKCKAPVTISLTMVMENLWPGPCAALCCVSRLPPAGWLPSVSSLCVSQAWWHPASPWVKSTPSVRPKTMSHTVGWCNLEVFRSS